MKIITQIGHVLLKFLSIILALVCCLPVILLPKTTLVPAWIWAPLAILDFALLISFFTIKNPWKSSIYPLVGILIIGLFAVISSQKFADTPRITTTDGQSLPGSIASLEKVNLNGSQQWVSIRGNDTKNPILLFLAGGPGGSQLTTERFAIGKLEENFIVVNWEQPGAGKSFDSVRRSTLTPDRYVEDGHALVMYLKQRFGQKKVYIVGESWGSALGILLAQRYPEDFYAFIGTGQMVAFLKTDQKCYDFSLNWARERGDSKKVEKLIKLGPPPYYGAGTSIKSGAYLLDTYEYMNQNPEIYDNGTNTWHDLAAPEYGLYDKLNWFRGIIDTFDIVYPQLWEVDFREQATHLDVPVYFLIGRYDINAPIELTEEYFNLLKAPHKEIIWFEHSGHNPWVSESAKFIDTIINQILPETM